MSTAYQRGDRVILIATADPHTRLTPGSLGTVTGTDPRHGQIHVKWDDGSSLAMLPGDGDQVAPVRPCCGHCPLPGPDRDALARYLASSPGWTPAGRGRDWTAGSGITPPPASASSSRSPGHRPGTTTTTCSGTPRSR